MAVKLNDLGELYRVQRRFAEAEPFYERALAIDRKALGPEHPNVARDLNYVGAIQRLKGNNEGAEIVFRMALSTWEKALGPDHPEVANCLDSLGQVLKDQGTTPKPKSPIAGPWRSGKKPPARIARMWRSASTTSGGSIPLSANMRRQSRFANGRSRSPRRLGGLTTLAWRGFSRTSPRSIVRPTEAPRPTSSTSAPLPSGQSNGERHRVT